MVVKLLRWAKRQFIGPYHELRRPAFPVNSELEARAAAIRLRERLGDPKPTRRLIVEEDTFVERRPFDDEFLFSVPPQPKDVPF